jgi:RNA polymerase sigma-70 factor (ECF subfamily)
MDGPFETTIHLVRSAQQGDRRALEDLFARYLPRVRQIVAFRLGLRPSQLEEHEDIVQEALLDTFRNLERYEERSEATFRNWVSQCVVNAIRMHFRREGAEKRGKGKVRLFGSFESEDTSAIVFASNAATPSAIYADKELTAKVEAAILGLKEHWREVIVQRLFCEMSYAEIGAELGLREEATARKLFSRAMAELRRACGLGGGEG